MKDFKIKAVLFTGKTYKNGESPIMIRVTKDRKAVYISTGYTAFPEQWNENQSLLYSSKPRIREKDTKELSPERLKALKKEYSKVTINPKYAKINAEIENKIDEVNSKLRKHKNINDFNIIIKLLKSDDTSAGRDINKSYLGYAYRVVQNEFDAGNIKSYKRYNTIVNRLEEFINGKEKAKKGRVKKEDEGKVKGKDLLFSDLTPDFLMRFEGWLKRQGNKTNTIHKNFKGLRTILYRAIKEGKFKQENNPFFTYKLKEDKETKKEKLTVEEMQRLKKVQVRIDSDLYHAKNCFLFSFYNAGIRIGDLLQIKWQNVENGRLNYKMGKNMKMSSVLLNKESLGILDKYRNEDSKPEDYIFPYLNRGHDILNPLDFDNAISSKTAIVNKALKKLAKMADIEKHLSFHIARHSFAEIARKKDISIYDISKALRHSSLKQTETYIKSLDDESLDKAFEKVFDGI